MLPVKYPPINPKCPHLLHGGDYNPDQWLAQPEILAEDLRLMKLAGCNAMSIGIFAWSALEPTEGRFTFDWLDRVMDNLAANTANARRLIAAVVPGLAVLPRRCRCVSALAHAIFTDSSRLNRRTAKKLELIAGKHLKPAWRKPS